MLDFYKWASENLVDFTSVTFVLVIGAIWLISAVGDAVNKE